VTTFAQSASPAIQIPETPDLARMRRETGARLRSAMAERGVDALILLGNNAVVYATGTSWPLGDAGLSYVERPVAVVLADDEWPHLFLPFREGAAQESDLPADHLHGPVYLEFDEGVQNFAQVLAGLIPAGALIAVDECTGAMSRAAKLLFPNGAPVDAASVVSAAKAIKTPDELACIRTAIRITDEAMVDVHKALAPGIRQTDLSASFLRRAFELGAQASMLEPIWQVMPQSKADGVWTTHGDLALPLLSTERELAEGDVLWTDVSITYRGYCSDFGRTWIVGRDPTPRQQAVFDRWQEIMAAVLGVARAGATRRRFGQGRNQSQRWQPALAAALLSWPRHRGQRRRNANDRNRSRRRVRREVRPAAGDGAGPGAGGVGGRHRRLPQRRGPGDHRGGLDAIDRLPV